MSKEKINSIFAGLAPLVDVSIVACVSIAIVFIIYEGVIFLASGA